MKKSENSCRKKKEPKGDTLPICVVLTYKSKWTAKALESDGQVLSKAASSLASRALQAWKGSVFAASFDEQSIKAKQKQRKKLENMGVHNCWIPHRIPTAIYRGFSLKTLKVS